MRRLLIPVALTLVVGLSIPAAAGPASSLLELGWVNLAEDVDYETGVIPDWPDNTTLAVGNTLWGMYKIDFLQTETGPNTGAQRFPSTNTYTGIFGLEVATKVETTSYNWTFKPVAAATWTALLGITPTASDTVMIVYDDKDAPGFIDASSGADAFAAMATAANGLEQWELGMLGGWNDTDNVPVDPDLFWRAWTETDDLMDIMNNPLNANFQPRLTYGFSLDVTEQTSWVTLMPHDFRFPGFLADMQGIGRNQDGDSGKFGIFTDSEIWILPTPEPGTFALLGLGLAGFGVAAYRRRRKTA